MFNEIDKNDSQEVNHSETPNYQDIKPENNLSYNKAKEFWDEKSNPVANEQLKNSHDSPTTENENTDNVQKIEENGFTFKVDKLRRPICAEGQLKVTTNETPRNMPSMESVGEGDQLKDDQMGHLIGRRFGGPDSIKNLVPQDGKLNQGDYKKLEHTLASTVNSGATVYMKVEPRYEGDSHRPSDFKVTYTINGEKEIVIFKNESRDKNV